ncbi:glycosyl hydrolase family 20 [Algoriphagus ratkowskyi]|uniref:beta-N-acetylhexosaminidase n=1 Tax=Algoriphagus ratkowskyi TaxID=57028 RepID=A0A2W7QVU4_9BACT|nr:family 20 glycosylhydrolase [Algoriphagus ratkowskyi]PZX52111.1 glycosyl hydrolase family 20 [Algoriphagus ratkowskyi]TXD76125.1 family 20 glycosylhydrolase [Algoriphagus ratkowskyi]
MKIYLTLSLAWFTFLSIHQVNAQTSQPESIQFRTVHTIEELHNAPVKLIPYPSKVEWAKGFVELKGLGVLKTQELSPVLSAEMKEIASDFGLDAKSGMSVSFSLDQNISEEGYQLKVSSSEVKIVASTIAGQFYGLKTLRQLLIRTGEGIQLPLVTITDEPAFPMRGLMIDVGRNYQSMEKLKEQLDIMADYKMNVFQWHLTDRPSWRIESKAFPQLNDAAYQRPTREPGKFYTYDEIRELFEYAKSKQILIIPELDMPGHSDSFIAAMKFRMESQEGMAALEVILEEFFKEIPKEMAPIIHIGSDEVHVPNPEEFIERMVAKVESDGRKVMVWSPGLPAHDAAIRQSWGEMDTLKMKETSYAELDSRNSYVNNAEPMTFVNKLLFKPISATWKNNECLGGILCLWHDVKVDDSDDVFRNNPIYPGMLTYAWATWTADVIDVSKKYMITLPEIGSVEQEYFAVFEDYLLAHKERYFTDSTFPYLKQSDKKWELYGPVIGSEEASKMPDLTNLPVQDAVGNTLIIRDRFKQGGFYPEIQLGETVYARTFIHSDEKKSVEAWVNFETPLRANRTYGGIPEEGKWDSYGGEIWINGAALSAPNWENPGWKPSKSQGWGTPVDQEIPWRAEELYWNRKPTQLHLNKGWNEVLIAIPYQNDYQNCMVTFAPFDMEGLVFSPNKVK